MQILQVVRDADLLHEDASAPRAHKEASMLSREEYLAMIGEEDRHEDEVEANTEPTSIRGSQ